MNNNVDIRRGDIFYIEAGGNFIGSEQKPGRPAIVVSNNIGNECAPVIEIVYLTSQMKKKMPTHVNVICRVPSTALCENIQTVSKNRIGDYIRTCSDSEMKQIDKALMCSLGIVSASATNEPSCDVIPTPVVEPSTAEVERNLYKSLYEQLLNKVMQS